MASLVAFHCCLIIYNCCVSFIVENKLVVVLVFAVFLCFQWEQHVHNEKQIHSQDLRKNYSAGSYQTSPGTCLWKVRLWCYPGMILSVCTVTVEWLWWFGPTFKADSSFLSWSLPYYLFWPLSGACHEDVAASTSRRHANLSIARRLAIARPELSGRRSSSTVFSQVCLGLPVLPRQSLGGPWMQARRAGLVLTDVGTAQMTWPPI